MTPPTEHDEKTALVQALRRIAAELGTNSVSRSRFVRHTGIPEHTVVRLFGSHGRFVEAAGLVPKKFRAMTYSNEELGAELVRVLRLPRAKLTIPFFHQHSRIPVSTYQRRFGSWRKALKAATAQLDPQRDRDLVARIRAYPVRFVGGSRLRKPAGKSTRSLRPTAVRADLESPVTDSEVPSFYSNVYGDFLHLPGLEHAPVNEEGVVFLFAMICRQLGYVVEMVQQSFPDCEAKRQLRLGIWQRVRIEFEFRSRTFRTHRHDPEQCDLIVCWENNWPDCPLEVLELQSACQRLALSPRGSGEERDEG